MKQYLTVQILIGLPGVGKSSYARKMKTINDRVKIINRDEIRCDIIAVMAAKEKGLLDRTNPGTTLAHFSYEKEFEEFVKEHKNIENLDDAVDAYERILLRTTIKRNRATTNPKKNFVILDGCHTKWSALKTLIDFIRSYEEVYLEVYMIGDDRSKCEIEVNDKKQNDYSDFCRSGDHSTIPREVLERKRMEYKELLTNHLRELKKLIDYGAMNCIDVDFIVPLEELKGHPSIHF